MLANLFGKFSSDLGIDLGTTSTLVYVRNRGIVVNEPSVVAINSRTDQIVAVGEDAKRMVGKTPAYISAAKPLVDGIISDFEVSEKMIKYFIEKVHQGASLFSPRPRVVIGIPLDVTEVEKKAVEDAVLSAGARQVFLVEEAMAGAIGCRVPIHEATGHMIVDIGGGTTEIAVVSLGGVVTWRSLKVAGNELDNDIVQYLREKFNLLIGETTAEEVKVKVGSAWPQEEQLLMNVRGRDLVSGLPQEVAVTDEQMRMAMSRSIKNIIENIKSIIELTPPELVADIYSTGIVLFGGGALLKGLDKLISHETKIPVIVADDPLTSVVRGTGLILEDLDALKNVFVPSTKNIGD